MAITGSISLQATAVGMPGGNLDLSSGAAQAAGNGTVTQVVLANGNNVITVPTSPAPSYAIIQFPANGGQVTTIKGATAGDVGIAAAAGSFAVIPLNTAGLPASLNLNSAGAQSQPTQITFL